MKIGSLFSGIGGLELGLEWAGLGPVAWQVEQEQFCREILARHWPDAIRFDDVCTVGAHNLAPVDVICGGFPCQDLSYAGKGAGIDGARSGLWREYARIVGEVRPRFVVVENVGALVTRGLDRVLGDLAALGYDAIWVDLRASDVGAPHRRERLFIIGWRALAAADRGCVQSDGDTGGIRATTPTAQGEGCQRQRGRDAARGGSAVVDPDLARLEGRRVRCGGRPDERAAREAGGSAVADGDGTGEQDGGDERSALAPGVRSVGEAKRSASVPCVGRRGLQGGAPIRLPQPRMGRAPDGIPARMDRWPARPGEAQHEWEAPRVAQGVPQRAARLKALGNGVVPQVAYVIGMMVRQIDAALDEERAA